MNAFRKNSNSRKRPDNFGCSAAYQTTVTTSKEVKKKGESEPTTYVEIKKLPVEEYSKSISMPEDKDYQLADMLANGQVPQEVPVSGMLDSRDPLDLQNQHLEEVFMNHLDNLPKAPETQPETIIENN